MCGIGQPPTPGVGKVPELADLVAVRIALDLRVLARIVRGGPGRQQPHGPRPQPQRAPGEMACDGTRSFVTERPQQRIVEECEAGFAYDGCERARIPGAHRCQRGVGDTARPFVPAEVLVLVRVEGALEFLEGLWHVLDAHVHAESAVVDGERPQFMIGEATPAVAVDPALRDHDERTQHIAHVVVAAVHLVDPADRRAPRVAVEAVLHHGVEGQRGVVVPLLRTIRQLSRFGEESADARNRYVRYRASSSARAASQGNSYVAVSR